MKQYKWEGKPVTPQQELEYRRKKTNAQAFYGRLKHGRTTDTG